MAPREESLHHKNTTRPTPSSIFKGWANHDTADILGSEPFTREFELPKTHEERVEAHAKAVEADFKKNDKPAWTGPRFLGHRVVETKDAKGKDVEITPAKQTSAFPADGDLDALPTFERKVRFGYPLLPEHLVERRGSGGDPQQAARREKDAANADAPAARGQ